jgi:hypothetical protein
LALSLMAITSKREYEKMLKKTEWEIKKSRDTQRGFST